MIIIGISAFYHDSAAAIIKDGEIIAATQEERFTRIKHDSSFPSNSIKYCLKECNITISDVDFIAFYEKPFLKFERLLETYLAFAPKGFNSFLRSMPIWIKDKLFQKKIIIDELKALFDIDIEWSSKLVFSEHHLSHASSAFFPSPFEKSAILTMDGVGEWATTSVAIGDGNKIEIIKEINFPHSLGLLYSAFTYYLGFKVNSGEYKVMGLAPYGEPNFVKIIKDNLIEIKEDGSFKLNMDYFDYCTGLTMTNKKFNLLFGSGPRKPEADLSRRDMDLASSIQKITEEIVIKVASNISKETNLENLCLAGGVALNCVANGTLAKQKIFKNIWIQPASGDAGGALGAALAINYLMLENQRFINKGSDMMKGSYLGPRYTEKNIEEALGSLGAVFHKYNKKKVINLTVEGLLSGKAIGWMNDRMEFGPRALGSRSIIADPRSKTMQKNLNLRVKYRESFRPFAPSILYEDLEKWFDIKFQSPYMLFVSKLHKHLRIKMTKEQENLFGIKKLNVARSKVPAITHVDYSARIQTVHKETNPDFQKLITKFKEITNCPILVNTSFNVRGEPIVCSPSDAFNCFMGTGLDILVIENFILFKTEQDPALKTEYREKYQLD